MKKILVLGGTGFVGAHVCEKLVRQGWQVTVPTRRRDNARHVQHLPGLTVLELNVHDEAALAQAVAGHEAVVNLIAILHGSPAAFNKAHVELPRNLARACLQAYVAQLVHVSALGVNDAQPEAAPSHYLKSKGAGEAVLQLAASQPGAFALTVLRPSVIFGAEDKFLNLFAKLQAVFPVMPLAGADARFQPVWVQDVAEAVVRSLSSGHQGGAPRVFELCGPEVFTLRQLVQLAARLSGVRHGHGRPVIALPHWAGWLQALLIECAPGEPLMSRDNLDSMRVANVASGHVPGLAALGITASALVPLAKNYLSRQQDTAGLPGLRLRARHR